MHIANCFLSFIKHFIHQPVLAGLLRGHVVVAVGVALDDLDGLAGLVGQDAVDLVADADDVIEKTA